MVAHFDICTQEISVCGHGFILCDVPVALNYPVVVRLSRGKEFNNTRELGMRCNKGQYSSQLAYSTIQ